MPVAGTPPLGSGNVQKVKTRLEKRTKKLNLPGVLTGGPGMSEQLSNLSNEELRKCINDKGYVVPDSCYLWILMNSIE